MANQSAAGRMYSELVLGLQRSGVVVGYAHCQHINRAVCHERPQPGSCNTSNPSKWAPALKQGLLDARGEPHAVLVAAVKEANGNLN